MHYRTIKKCSHWLFNIAYVSGEIYDLWKASYVFMTVCLGKHKCVTDGI